MDKSTALDCFDYSLVGDKALNKANINPEILEERKGYVKEALITYKNTTCFAENRHILTGGSFVMNYGPSVYIVLDGEAEICGDDYKKTVRKGEYFFLPYSAEGKFSVSGTATLIERLPSTLHYFFG